MVAGRSGLHASGERVQVEKLENEVRHIAIESESLNAAMAATVALYEWNRVRA